MKELPKDNATFLKDTKYFENLASFLPLDATHSYSFDLTADWIVMGV